MSGRLEVYHQGYWGTVCDDGFNNNAAMVVCRQLGFNPVGAIAVPYAYFGKGADPIWLDYIICDGLEPNIDFCHHGTWGLSDCHHFEDVGVVCSCKSLCTLK